MIENGGVKSPIFPLLEFKRQYLLNRIYLIKNDRQSFPPLAFEFMT